MSKLEKSALINKLTENLPVLRRKLGFSQLELAELAGVSRSTIANIERGRSGMTWNMFLSLIAIFICNGDTSSMLQIFGIYTSYMNDHIIKAAHRLHSPCGSGNSCACVLKGFKVLLVDDDEAKLKLNQAILEADGVKVLSAGSEKEAESLFGKDSDLDLIIVNADMAGRSSVELVKNIRTLEADSCNRTPIIALCAENGGGMSGELLAAGADGCTGRPIEAAQLLRVFIANMKDRSELLQQRLAETMRLAQTDMLTGVKNSTAYMAKLEEINAKMKSDPELEYAIVMCDINELKQENDRCGHSSGDQYIKNCSAILCDVFAHSPVFRIGGDEFIVILQGADLSNQSRLMKLLTKRVKEAAKLPYVASGRADFSYGLAVYDAELDKAAQDTVKRADAAMYRIKL